MSEWTQYKNGIRDTHKIRIKNMLDFIKIKNDLESSFNSENSEGVDVDINISVINEDNGKFSVSVFDERCYVNNQHLPHADITVGFLCENLFNNSYLIRPANLGSPRTFMFQVQSKF